MNDFGFRFYIHNYHGKFNIKIGLDWDEWQFIKYIDLEKTAFAAYAPVGKFHYEKETDAQTDLEVLRDWIKRLTEAQPNSKQFLRQ